MRHDISLACVRYRLRPVRLEDAQFIVELRKDPLLNRFLHETSPRVEDQVLWLERYFERPNDYYFVVEEVDSGERQGTIGLYDMVADQAEWGRWILKRGSLAALESIWLIHEIGFSRLRLASMYSLTITENERVLSLHRSFGASEAAFLEARFVVRGEAKPAVEYRIQASVWPALRSRHYAKVSSLVRGAGIKTVLA